MPHWRLRRANRTAPSITGCPWDHPMINTIGEEQGVAVEIAPTENFGFDRFIAEANEENSTWDSYGGVTPFLEMIALVNTGTIEPWDEYLPEGMIDDFAPAVTGREYLGRQVLRLAAAARYHRPGEQHGSRRKSRARSNGGAKDLGRVYRERAQGAGERRRPLWAGLRQPRLAVVDSNDALD